MPRRQVRSKRFFRLLVLVLGLGAALPSYAFRCGNELVSEGDRKYEVLSKCGEPDYREHRAHAYLRGVGPIGVTDTWYYDLGPRKFVRILTFQRGKLRSIETDERGFGGFVDDGRACEPQDIEVGMSKYALLGRCGMPEARDEWFEQGPLRDRDNLQGVVRVEEWTYAFGSTRFLRFVRIVDGEVVAVEHGDKGR